MVGVAIDRRLLTRRVRPRDRRFEREYRPGAPIRVVESRERQQPRDVLLVAAPLFDEARRRAEVLVTVSERKATLHQERAVGLLAMDAVLHRQPEYRRRSVDAEVQRIHVGVHGPAEQACERKRVAGPIDPRERLRERSDALGVD